MGDASGWNVGSPLLPLIRFLKLTFSDWLCSCREFDLLFNECNVFGGHNPSPPSRLICFRRFRGGRDRTCTAFAKAF